MKNIKSFEEFSINEAKGPITPKTNGVYPFKIGSTPYTMYPPMRNDNIYEIYKFDDDHGPVIMRLKFTGKGFDFLYGGFDMDLTSSAQADNILNHVFGMFGFPKEDKPFDSKLITYKN